MISYKSPAILLCAVLALGADRSGYPTGAQPLAPEPTAADVDVLADRFDAFTVKRCSDSLRSIRSDRPETVKMYGSLPMTAADAIEMAVDVAEQSVLAGTMISDGMGDEAIPMPNVDKATLVKIIDYMTRHAPSNNGPAAEIVKPLKSTNLLECGVDEWDCGYIDVPQEELFKIILAANYMDIKPLLDLSCAKVASMIKGKNTQEIRDQFNIVNDFTPEEEAQVREENRWAEDTAASSTPAP